MMTIKNNDDDDKDDLYILALNVAADQDSFRKT